MSSSPEQFKPERKGPTNRKEAVLLYKKAVAGFLNRCAVIDRERREWWKKNGGGLEYLGFMNWSKEDYEWKEKAEKELERVGQALGLSGAEVEEIWEKVKQGRLG